MRTKSQIIIRLILSVFILVFMFGLYTRLPGTENIRSIHIITLVTAGMAIGIFLVNFFLLVKLPKESQKDNK
jgi:hypothetical protein